VIVGFLSDNRLAHMNVSDGRITAVGLPVAAGTVDFSAWHAALDDAAGVLYTSMVPDSGTGVENAMGGGARHVEEVGKWFIGVDIHTGKVVLKVHTPDELMYLHLVPSW
jgi:hypothetical protein